jgi:hypothetical protein
MDGAWKVAESILAGKAPPLDALNAIAVHYILDDHPELVARASDGDAHDSMATSPACSRPCTHPSNPRQGSNAHAE